MASATSNSKETTDAATAKRPVPLPEEEPTVAVASSSFLDEAFDKTVNRFARHSMPLIMHGSGDVEPSRVDPAAAHFLASLTTQYTAKLVDAAVDTFAMFLNQDEPLRVPPPPFAQHRLPPPPRPLLPPNDPNPVIILQSQNEERKPPREKPKRKMRAEYWDEPLPEPKIRKKDAATSSTKDNEPKKKEPIETWTGAIGVDFHSQSIRRAHMPLGLSTPNFVFPICHDVYAYGRVRHIQAAKRGSIDTLLQDHCIPDILQHDEKALARFAKRGNVPDKKDKQVNIEDDEELVDPASWPDIEGLLLPGYPSSLDK